MAAQAQVTNHAVDAQKPLLTMIHDKIRDVVLADRRLIQTTGISKECVSHILDEIFRRKKSFGAIGTVFAHTGAKTK